MELKNFIKKYDPKADSEWFEFNEVKFLIAPTRNPHQKKKIQEMFTLQEAIGLEEEGALAFKDVKANVAVGKVYALYAHSLVFGWDGITEDGEAAEFSHEKIHEFMMEDPEFAAWVIQKANELFIKRATAKEEVVKN